MLETLPALEHIVVPGTARHVLVQVIIAGREDVETGTHLIGNNDRVRIGELLAKPRVHHGGVEGAAP